MFQSLEAHYYENTESLEADQEKLKLGIDFRSLQTEVSIRHSQKSIPNYQYEICTTFPAKLPTAN